MSESESCDDRNNSDDMKRSKYGSTEQHDPETDTHACAQQQEVISDQPEVGAGPDADEAEVKMIRHKYRWRQWWRRVEPIIVLYYVASAAMGSIYQQYLYARVSKHKPNILLDPRLVKWSLSRLSLMISKRACIPTV